jgi:hypothetical protein
VVGIEGIMNSYKGALQKVQLAGPTLFNPIINQAMRIAAGTQPGSVYHVLLILTDGEIHDMNETKFSVVEASHNLPLSIIIIGVGSADFKMMDALDSDAASLRDSRGRAAARDVVQFVPFRKF